MALFTCGNRVQGGICKPIVDTKVKVFLRKHLFYQLSTRLPGLLTVHVLLLVVMVKLCISGVLLRAELFLSILVTLVYCPMSLLSPGRLMVNALPLPVVAL